MERVKILFLSANPSRDVRLDELKLDEEFREITAKIRSSDYRDAFELIPCLAVRPDDLRSALLQHQPDILHFSGHGTPSDGLVLLDKDSNPFPVSQSALVELLRTIKGDLRLVVLNACYSQPLAKEFSDVVDCSIGVSKKIGDQAAIKFAGAFYEALGYANSVQDAFNVGSVSLKMDGHEGQTPEERNRTLILPDGGKDRSHTNNQMPQLITGLGVDAAAVYLVKPKLSHEELTRYARQRIAEEASRWLAEECDPFVMPALARRNASTGGMMSRRDADPWEKLENDESRRLVLGELPENQNRVRIFSDSGTGKTTLMHYCEQEIAKADDGRVPVRVSALSSYDWKGDVPITLVNRVLHAYLPAYTDEAERIDWLKQLIRDHRVVLLLDAVDQTDDQLAGLSQFLQSADVCHCPAILTGRPEVEQTRSGVFQEGHWETHRVEPLDEPRIREYLGELSDKLLPVEGEDWRDRPSWERKRQWADLLHVPLLLRLLRRLTADDAEGSTHGSLTDLHNRHAVYREAVRHLIDQGWTSLAQTPNREDLLDHAEVNQYLSEMAWGMVADDNFTSVFHGKSFQRWRAENRQAVRALEQVDLTTRYSLLDNPGELGLAWRHLSFCEYFAGVHLAGQPRAEQEAMVREHGRQRSWQWVFRFALSELVAEGDQDGCAALARDLVRFGNPFLTYDAIRGDGLQLPKKLDELCRWLVHRDYGDNDYSEAWESEVSPPDLDDDVLGVLEKLFSRTYRDSRCLHPAWELLERSSDPQAAAIKEAFLSEFNEKRTGAGASSAVAESLGVDQHFLPCPPVNEKRRTFKIGEDANRPVKVNRFYLGKAPITNLQFELFDPSHEQWRNQYSHDDDSPALYVSWYMTVMFCTWLGQEHRLPTEEEWEVACRAGTTSAYWWGDDFDKAKCNAERNVGHATAADPAHANEWGFMEMCGNVDEWCSDGDESSRVLRGGSWSFPADFCRCSSRLVRRPYYRYFYAGFRLARTYP